MKKVILNFLASFFLFSSFAFAFEGDYSYDYTPLTGLGANYQLHFYPEGNGKYWVDTESYPFLWRQQDEKTILLIMEDRNIEVPTSLSIISETEIKVGDDIFAKIQYEDHEDFDEEPEDYPDAPSSAPVQAKSSSKPDTRKPLVPGSEREKAYKTFEKAKLNPFGHPYTLDTSCKVDTRSGLKRCNYFMFGIDEDMIVENIVISFSEGTCGYEIYGPKGWLSFPFKIEPYTYVTINTRCIYKANEHVRFDVTTNVGDFWMGVR